MLCGYGLKDCSRAGTDAYTLYQCRRKELRLFMSRFSLFFYGTNSLVLFMYWIRKKYAFTFIVSKILHKVNPLKAYDDN